MKDPYILENGTLKNLLNITDEKELKKAERDIGFAKLMDIGELSNEKCDVELLKKIHKHIFEDIFDWAGEFRTVPMIKIEEVIPMVSIDYAEPKNIKKELESEIKKINKENWKNKDFDEKIKSITKYVSSIWRTHPFRDGNTRTTLAFTQILAKKQGIDLDLGKILNDLGRRYNENGRVTRWSVRDRFVLAALDENNYPEPQWLEETLKSAAITKKQEKEEDLGR